MLDIFGKFFSKNLLGRLWRAEVNLEDKRRMCGTDSDLFPAIVPAPLQREWKMQLFIGMWFVTCIGAIVVVAIVEMKIASHFVGMGSTSHSSTRKMHKDFHRALLAMVRPQLFQNSTT